jgi:hypothetical protein
MTNTSIRWGLAVGATLLAQIALIATSIIVVAVYSYTVHTGETQAFYNAFAQRSGPWVSLIAGGPVFYLIGRWIRRRAPAAALGTMIAFLGFYLAIEVAAILVWPNFSAAILAWVFGGLVIKAVCAWLGIGGSAARAVATA